MWLLQSSKDALKSEIGSEPILIRVGQDPRGRPGSQCLGQIGMRIRVPTHAGPLCACRSALATLSPRAPSGPDRPSTAAPPRPGSRTSDLSAVHCIAAPRQHAFASDIGHLASASGSADSAAYSTCRHRTSHITTTHCVGSGIAQHRTAHSTVGHRTPHITHHHAASQRHRHRTAISLRTTETKELLDSSIDC